MDRSTPVDSASAGTPAPDQHPTVLHVCTTCNRDRASEADDGLTGGEHFLLALQEAFADKPVALRSVQCLMGCEHACNVHLCDPAKYSYVIGRFEPDAVSAQALADYAELYCASETGRVPYKQWPQAIKGHFIARMPPLDEIPE
ncbi:MAG: DUF1636 domain-containing protein [Pseudomonadota bacterium]